jgi:hypothetical protein
MERLSWDDAMYRISESCIDGNMTWEQALAILRVLSPGETVEMDEGEFVVKSNGR